MPRAEVDAHPASLSGLVTLLAQLSCWCGL
jgi:hypothetical protein